MEDRVRLIVAEIDRRILVDAREGIGAPLDYEEMILDVIGAEPDEVAEAVRSHYGVGVLA